MSKLSIIIPVYYNEKNLPPLFESLDKELIPFLDDYELIFVDDGSGDNSWDVLQEYHSKRNDMKLIRLSRNFGAQAAVMAGFSNSVGDCAIIKTADLQEPAQLILDMYNSWKQGNNVVIGLRRSRHDGAINDFFSRFYYWIMRKTTLKNMPQNGFDIVLVDRKVVNALELMNESNSALNLQVLWVGFKTGYVEYDRKEREVGKSRWTFSKKFKLVIDSMVSFSSFPIRFMSVMGIIFALVSVIWAIISIIGKLTGSIEVEGWTSLLIVMLFSSGLIMLTLGILGEYIWRTLDSARSRPVYIVEEKKDFRKDENINNEGQRK